MKRKSIIFVLVTLLLAVTTPVSYAAQSDSDSYGFNACSRILCSNQCQNSYQIFAGISEAFEAAKKCIEEKCGSEGLCGGSMPVITGILTGACDENEDAPPVSEPSVPADTVDDDEGAQDTELPSETEDSPAADPVTYQYADDVLALVNAERESAGLSGLELNDSLCAAALIKSRDMAENNYFSHTSPTFGSSFELLKSRGITYSHAGENIAKGYSTPESVMNGWMNSSGHRANILNSSFTQLGVGYYEDSDGQAYWTQIFIRP